ncbi:MAG TPA: tripartite tricarboxylate transporter permease [Bacillota bacterium]|jgi:putative tricarboxylic transport membrane protein
MDPILHGLAAAFNPTCLLWAAIGAVLGTVVGILPGLGPAATVALLLPITLYLSPTLSLVLLAGIYYGAQYGGSTTSILLNIPGESASVVTCLDGYPLALQGKAGQALAMAAIGSFIAGTIGLVLFTLAARPLAEAGLAFGPPEQFMLMVGSLLVAGTFGESVVRGVIAALLGLLLSFVGADPISGINRFVFGIPYLYDGFDFVPVAVGLFAIGEVFSYLWKREGLETHRIPPVGLRDLIPKMNELITSFWAMIRGSVVGFVTGVLPGMGAVPASFISYSLERRVSKHPERFGKGAIEGVAAPESANNGAVIGALLPMFSLGIPGSATTAMLLAGLMMWGLQPGPLLMSQHPEVVWPVIGSLYLANLVLLAINLPGAVFLAQIARIHPRWLMPIILGLSLTGAFAATGNIFGPFVAVVFGAIGLVFRRADYPLAPLLLGLVLGGAIEQNLRRSLVISQGNPAIFFTRPICIAIIFMTLVLLVAGNRLYRAGPRESKDVRQDEPQSPSSGPADSHSVSI